MLTPVELHLKKELLEKVGIRNYICVLQWAIEGRDRFLGELLLHFFVYRIQGCLTVTAFDVNALRIDV